MIVSISCAPKIGPVLYDPLIYESQNSFKSEDTPTDNTSDDWLTAPALRNNDKPTEGVPKKTCQGYDYDLTQCRYINDRKICGYNKNKGEPEIEEIKDMGNGCRIRNNRLECGYLAGPFNPPRRPPANDDIPDKTDFPKLRSSPPKTSKKELNDNKKTTTIRKAPDGNPTAVKNPIALENVDDIEVRTKRDSVESTIITTDINVIDTTSNDLTTQKKVDQANKNQLKKICVDKVDRIFCYTAREKKK
ncbi:unnamed protein product [Colias eurytheme]|nr:unnamed protein product [Colias eurytheme]